MQANVTPDERREMAEYAPKHNECDQCATVGELYHDEASGMSLCDPCVTAACEIDIRREAAKADRDKRERIRMAGNAYMAARDGATKHRGAGEYGPTDEAVRVLSEVYDAHMAASGLALDYLQTATLWAEIMRRSSEALSLREQLTGVSS